MVKKLPKTENASGTIQFGGQFPKDFHTVATHAAKKIENISLNSYIIRTIKRDPAYKEAIRDLARLEKEAYATNSNQTNSKHQGRSETSEGSTTK